MTLKELENASKRITLKIGEIKNQLNSLHEEMDKTSNNFKKATIKSKIAGILSFIMFITGCAFCFTPSILVFAAIPLITAGGLFAYSQFEHNKGIDLLSNHRIMLDKEHHFKVDLSDLDFKAKGIEQLINYTKKNTSEHQSVFVSLNAEEVKDLNQEELNLLERLTKTKKSTIGSKTDQETSNENNSEV